MKLTLLQRILFSVLLTLFVVGLYSLDHFNTLFKKVEERSIDYRFLAREARKVYSKKDILIVYIDEEAAKEYGYLTPIPRKLLAKLITDYSNKGAAAIGVDVWLNDFYDKESDDVLEEALKNHGKKVVLFSRMNEDNKSHTQKPVLDRFLKHVNTGFASSLTQEDEVHRWVNLGIDDNKRAFSMEIIKLFSGEYPKNVELVDANSPEAWKLINFTGPASLLENEDNTHSFNIVSAGDWLPKKMIEGKIILIGAAIQGRDQFLTPFSLWGKESQMTFGIELQAMTIDMLLNNIPYEKISSAKFKLYFSIILIVFSFICLSIKGYKAIIFLFTFLVLWFSAVFLLFVYLMTLTPLMTPMVLFILTFIATQLIIQSHDSKHALLLKSNFQHYVSPELVEEMIATGKKPKLGGEKQNLTILFTDLKGFTALSEKMAPEDLVSFLNEYFDIMTNVLKAEGGTLDKYIGDSIMAFYGAPLPLEKHALRACKTALKMQKKLDTWNESHPELDDVSLRIGINTDDVIVGNTGSEKFMNYTVIGDGVNVASRLESINKQFGTKIAISEATLKSVEKSTQSSPFKVRELGLLKVKGKDKARRVYELMDENIKGENSVTDHEKLYSEALKYFQNGNFDNSLNLFIELKKVSTDAIIDFYLSQINFYKKNPPKESWKGEITMLVK